MLYSIRNSAHKKTGILFIVFAILTTVLNGQNDSWKYFGQTPPGKSAELFVPGIINHLAHSSPSFTPDGKEMYWSTVSGENETRKIYYVKFENGKWSEPILASISGNYHDDQPFISSDGEKLFFASKRPKVKNGTEENDIWISNKTEQAWGEPKPINNLIGLWTPTLTSNGTIYFLDLIDSTRVICRAELEKGEYAEIEILNENINQKGALNWCPFIAPDESYLIFSSDRDGNIGNGDLYISFRDEKGKWQEAINMGSLVNTDKQERFPGVSPDGKYLFFTRWHSIPYYHDIYWVDAQIIEDIKNSKLKLNETITVQYEPYEWKTASPESVNINTDSLKTFFDRISDWENLTSVLIIKDDKIILEKYYHGFNKYSAYNAYSTTKSITSALIGIANKQNFIGSENDTMMAYFPEYNKKKVNPEINNITLKHLLTMTSGLKPEEWWNPSIDYAIQEAPFDSKPGEKFSYYNALPHLLSAIISKTTNLSIKEFAERNLFEPLGMKCAYWKKDGDYYSGRSNTYFTPRDLARLGTLYLNKGNINGEQIINSSWIEKSFENYAESDKNFFLTGHSLNQTAYGYLWWRFEANGIVYYGAYGAGDQFLLINPLDNTIVVISQLYKDTWFEKKEDIDMISELLSIICKRKVNI